MLSSPHRLHLHLNCTKGTPLREMLDIFPPFPIEIMYPDYLGEDIVVVLDRRDRICKFSLNLTCRQLERFATVTQEPFPALTSLHIWSEILPKSRALPVLPVTFLKGFVPRLRSLSLTRIPFPMLPQLLLSSNNLSELFLESIPDLGFISPEAMVMGLSALTRLRCLWIGFQWPYDSELPYSPIQCPPPFTRDVLPTLAEFKYNGRNEYLEDLLAGIDAPQLKSFRIMLFRRRQHPLDIRQVIYHSRTLSSFNRIEVTFYFLSVVGSA
jgi:hypothetical protein